MMFVQERNQFAVRLKMEKNKKEKQQTEPPTDLI